MYAVQVGSIQCSENPSPGLAITPMLHNESLLRVQQGNGAHNFEVCISCGIREKSAWSILAWMYMHMLSNWWFYNRLLGSTRANRWAFGVTYLINEFSQTAAVTIANITALNCDYQGNHDLACGYESVTIMCCCIDTHLYVARAYLRVPK
jgi:hypothetical protein